MVICLERGVDLHIAQLMPLPLTLSCFSKIQIGFTFLVPAHPSSPVQRAVKRVCVDACIQELGMRYCLRERLGIDDIALVLQQNRLRWYGHMLRKEDGDWVKKCMVYEVEGPRPKRTWREVAEKDCQAHKLNKEDAVDRGKWRKLIKNV